MTPEQERLHLKKCDYNLGYCDLNDPQCECEATPTTAEQERAEARIDKAKLLEWLIEREGVNAYDILRQVIVYGKFDINSLDREEQLMQQYEKYSEALKGAKTTNLELAREVAERDKEIQQYKAALEEIAQGGDKDYVGNVLRLTSSECRTIARKALNQS